MADQEVFGKNAIREAIALLREYGVTPEEYATVELIEVWTVDGVEYPDRSAAFRAAQEIADRKGEWAEVWLEYGPEIPVAESWVVAPERGPEVT